MSTVPKIERRDGQSIPQLGFGVFQIPPEETAEAVRRALDGHLKRLAAECDVAPAVNQIELHPYFDYELDARDMGRTDALDRGESGRNGPHPDEFGIVPS